jgi:Tfp pilus assembly protein PilE
LQAASKIDLPPVAPVQTLLMRGRWFRFGLLQLLTAVALLAVILVIALPIFRQVQRDSEFRQCETRLHHIALALQQYHDAYGQYPPVHVPDASGLPAHSWRVLLLPFLDKTAESAAALSKYRFNEPWNGPNNSKLSKNHAFFKSCPRFFRCPSDGSPKKMTSYVAVVGPNTMWPDSLYFRMADLVDGMSRTIIVVELANSDIEWLEPRDLPIAQLQNSLKLGSKPELFTSHERDGIQGGIVVFADGHTEFLPHSIGEKNLNEMLNPVNESRR